MCDDTKQAHKNKALDSFFRFIDSWIVNKNENKTTEPLFNTAEWSNR